MSNIQLVIRSNLENVWMVGVTINRLCTLVLSQTACNEIELAVVEAVNNCIEHAYQQQDGQTISIDLTLDDAAVTVAIVDTGAPLDPALVAKIKVNGLVFDPADVDNLPEGGMGWFLINSMVDEVHYDATPNHNILILRKNFISNSDD